MCPCELRELTDVDQRSFGPSVDHGFHSVVGGKTFELVFAGTITSGVENFVDLLFDKRVFDLREIVVDDGGDVTECFGHNVRIGVGGGDAVGDAGAERVPGEPVIDHALNGVDEVGETGFTVSFPDAVEDGVVRLPDLFFREASGQELAVADDDGAIVGGEQRIGVVFGVGGVEQVFRHQEREHLFARPEAGSGRHDGRDGHFAVPSFVVHEHVHHLVACEHDVASGHEVGTDQRVLDDAHDGFVGLCGAKVFRDAHQLFEFDAALDVLRHVHVHPVCHTHSG